MSSAAKAKDSWVSIRLSHFLDVRGGDGLLERILGVAKILAQRFLAFCVLCSGNIPCPVWGFGNTPLCWREWMRIAEKCYSKATNNASLTFEATKVWPIEDVLTWLGISNERTKSESRHQCRTHPTGLRSWTAYMNNMRTVQNCDFNPTTQQISKVWCPRLWMVVFTTYFRSVWISTIEVSRSCQ